MIIERPGPRRPAPRRNPWLKVGATVGAGALAAALLGVPPSAAAPAAPLTLERGAASVTGYVFDGESYLDLGVHVVAGARPVEIRAHRTSYRQRLRSEWVGPGPDKALPLGAVSEDFSGLANFFSLTITDRAGKVVSDGLQTFCPNSYQPVRRRPNAPITSPYPQSCYGNPYSLGAVYGIQAGYATPAFGFFGDTTPVALPVGEFTAKISITPGWQKILGLAGGQNSTTVQITMLRVTDEEEDRRTSAAQRKATAAQQLAASQEQPERQARAAVPEAPERLAARQQSRPSGPLPDLRSLPAWGIYVARGRYLSFNATVWNSGRGPLMVDGFRRSNQPVMDAFQYFFAANGQVTGYLPVGTMEWDPKPVHSHWHFTDFATYRLLDARGKLVTTSGKEAFCLANTDMVDYTVPGANWQPEGTDLSTACGDESALGVRQVLDSGSGDTYNQVQNTAFDLKDLPNGTYFIEVLANPDNKLFESSKSNNRTLRKVVVAGRANARTVTVPQIGIIKEPPIFGGED